MEIALPSSPREKSLTSRLWRSFSTQRGRTAFAKRLRFLLFRKCGLTHTVIVFAIVCLVLFFAFSSSWPQANDATKHEIFVPPFMNKSLSIPHHAEEAVHIAEETLQEDIKRGEVYDGVDAKHFHGKIGYNEDGTPNWTPTAIKFKMTDTQKSAYHEGYCFNTRVAESLALDRDVPDFNHNECFVLQKTYGRLPQASVIIVFHNENLAVLIRSVHSILNRTPPELLKEIVLVDDYSDGETHPWLKGKLDDHLKTVPKTRVRRLESRHGLMMARMMGTDWASAPVAVYLDSHIECAPNWLEPLLFRIKQNRKAVVVPRIHTIGFDNMVFDRNNLSILGFSWTLGQFFLPHRHVHPYEPTTTVIMAGGLFAIEREWFLELGGYDDEMRLYGGEEMEISFKIWQCGGTLEVIPCSRVGHIFRQGTYWKGQVYKVPGEEIFRNKLRAAEVWMDEYKDIVRMSVVKLSPEFIGSTEKQKAIRERLSCKPFKWLLENIYPEQWVPNMKNSRSGALKNVQLSACIDCLGNKFGVIGAYPCHGQHGSQGYFMSGDGEIRSVESNLGGCFGVNSANSVFIDAQNCGSGEKKGVRWDLTPEGLLKAGDDRCVVVERKQTPLSPYNLYVADCDQSDPFQMWVFDDL